MCSASPRAPVVWRASPQGASSCGVALPQLSASRAAAREDVGASTEGTCCCCCACPGAAGQAGRRSADTGVCVCVESHRPLSVARGPRAHRRCVAYAAAALSVRERKAGGVTPRRAAACAVVGRVLTNPELDTMPRPAGSGRVGSTCTARRERETKAPLGTTVRACASSGGRRARRLRPEVTRPSAVRGAVAHV